MKSAGAGEINLGAVCNLNRKRRRGAGSDVFGRAVGEMDDQGNLTQLDVHYINLAVGDNDVVNDLRNVIRRAEL